MNPSELFPDGQLCGMHEWMGKVENTSYDQHQDEVWNLLNQAPKPEDFWLEKPQSEVGVVRDLDAAFEADKQNFKAYERGPMWEGWDKSDDPLYDLHHEKYHIVFTEEGVIVYDDEGNTPLVTKYENWPHHLVPLKFNPN